MVCKLIGNEARFGCIGGRDGTYSPEFLYIFMQTILTDLEDEGLSFNLSKTFESMTSKKGDDHNKVWKTQTQLPAVFQAKLVEPNTPKGHFQAIKGWWATPAF